MRAVGPGLFALLLLGCSSSSVTKAQVGKLVFEDTGMSSPGGQSCADCHAATTAFSDPDNDSSTSAGVVVGRFGPRNAQTAMYAAYIPPLRVDGVAPPVGGLFWDGRAASLEQQAEAPLLNPLEMNNPDKATVVEHVRGATYAPLFREAFGATSLDDVDGAFTHITEAIAAFERTSTFAPFSSRYDHYLAGTVTLTEQELRGLAIFEDPQRGNCAGCHPNRPGADGSRPLFTSFGYANLGVPRYANSKFFLQPPPWNPAGDQYIDHGLMRTIDDPAYDGMFRVPTLRNIARTAPYGHNGYFASLAYFVDFVNTRDVGSPDVGAWPEPEVAANVDRVHVGHLGLSTQDVYDVVAFLGTLTDEQQLPHVPARK
jgi:cytochrome c peroxidase